MKASHLPDDRLIELCVLDEASATATVPIHS